MEGALAQAAADGASSAARAEGGGGAPTPDGPGGGAQSATSRSSATHHHQSTAASARAARPTRPGALSRPKYARRRLEHSSSPSPGYLLRRRRSGWRGDAGARARPHGDWGAAPESARPRPNTISGATLRAAAAARPPHAANFTRNCGRAVMRYVPRRGHLHSHHHGCRYGPERVFFFH